jgi:hypothetical protein
VLEKFIKEVDNEVDDKDLRYLSLSILRVAFELQRLRIYFENEDKDFIKFMKQLEELGLE